jgi:hypothetical protein
VLVFAHIACRTYNWQPKLGHPHQTQAESNQGEGKHMTNQSNTFQHPRQYPRCLTLTLQASTASSLWLRTGQYPAGGGGSAAGWPRFYHHTTGISTSQGQASYHQLPQLHSAAGHSVASRQPSPEVPHIPAQHQQKPQQTQNI